MVNSSTKKKNDKEMVDVVDEACKVIDSVLKTEAHAKGLLHKTVIGGVRTSRGEIMVVEQAGDRQEPGQYVNPVGGHVTSGESEEDALRREAMEEMGFVNFEFKLIGKAIFNREILNRIENHYFLLYEITTDEKPRLGPEAVGYRLFKPEEYKNALKKNPQMFGASHLFVLANFYPELLK